MPRKKRKDVRELLRKRIEQPDTAERIAEALLSFLNAPDKAKAADILKLLDFAAEGQSAQEAVTVPDDFEDLSGYSDAELRAMLWQLKGGNARAP